MIGAMRVANRVPLRRSLQQIDVHPSGLRLSTLSVDDHAQVTIQGEPVAGANARGGFRNARHARNAVLSSDDRAMDQHAATAFDDACR